jgi:hypothetical protein
MRRISPRSVLTAIALSLFLLTLIFIINNSHDIETPPVKCDCPTVVEAAPKIDKPIVVKTEPPVPPKAEPPAPPKTEPPVVPKTDTTTSTQTPPLTYPPCKQVEKSSSVQRAIIIYYPSHQWEYFFPEIRWYVVILKIKLNKIFLIRLYRSWIEMLRGQASNWRTDFVIFTYNFSAEFRSLGCVNRIRQNKEEPSVCRIFLYVPIQFRTKNVTDNNFQYAFENAKKLAKYYNDSLEQMVTIPMLNDPQTYDAKRSDSLYVNLRTYGYIDSINSIYEGYNTFKMYDFVLRTDIGKVKLDD